MAVRACPHLAYLPRSETCVWCWLSLYSEPHRRAMWPAGDAPDPPPGERPPKPKGRPDVSRPPDGGPGTELEKLIGELGLGAFAGCDCKSLARMMDRAGVEGCRAMRGKIVDQLRNAKAHLTWVQSLKAAKNAVLAGLAFKLKPLDPAPGLVDEAIRRAGRGT